MKGALYGCMEYPAHIRVENKESKKRVEVQTVGQHCLNTAKYAGECLVGIELDKPAYLAGLCHDAGKAQAAFKDYIEKAANGDAVHKGEVIHTFQGCRILLENHNSNAAPITELDVSKEILAYAIGAHHGLFDCIDLEGNSGFDYRITKKEISFDECKIYFMALVGSKEKYEELLEEADCALRKVYEKLRSLVLNREEYSGAEFSFYLAATTRLILSAVIEGDRRDTAEFMEGRKFQHINKGSDDIWEKCLTHMEGLLGGFRHETPIEVARNVISEKCKIMGSNTGKVFRLNLPTGAGKTLSSLRFSLAHAAKWNKKRIIFVAPLLTIIDQNAAIIKKFIGDEKLVLEHHSDVFQDKKDASEITEAELLTDNWEAPVIITTMAQLLLTLFSGKLASIRRFHSLCESIIVIDEVQTIPNRMLTLVNLMINFFSEICGTTFVLCSATQPRLENTVHPLLEKPVDIIKYNEELWNPFKRTKIVEVEGKRLDEITEFVLDEADETDSLLVICNKKGEAQYLYKELRKSDKICFHLSAAMCTEHRKKVLCEINNCLESGAPIICISTQVIEAGVDISFKKVIRFAAGIDSIVQSAGRCNRNAEVEGLSTVYVVNCIDENLQKLRDIKEAKTAFLETSICFKEKTKAMQFDLSSEAAISYYYKKLYEHMPLGYQDYNIENGNSIFDLLSGNTKSYDSLHAHYAINQAFKTAGDLFKVFDENTISVVVPYAEGEILIEELNCIVEEKGKYLRTVDLEKWHQKIKPYTISIYSYQKELLEEKGELYLCGGVYILNQDSYDAEMGMMEDRNQYCFMEV